MAGSPSLRQLIRDRISEFIPPNSQPWFNLGSMGGIQRDGDSHALYLHESSEFRKVEPIRISTDEVWMLGEALLVYAEHERQKEESDAK